MRFDVRLTRKKTLRNGDLFQYYLEIYNILNSDNECSANFECDDDGNRIPQIDPLLPSFVVLYVFERKLAGSVLSETSGRVTGVRSSSWACTATVIA